MEKRILNYRKYIDELLRKEEADWKEILEQHLVQISFFQHERLIHLIVTVTFAILEMIAIAATVISFTPMLAVLDILLLVLFVPYVRHYYIMENETQKMYAQYDALLLKIQSSQLFSEKTLSLCEENICAKDEKSVCRFSKPDSNRRKMV